MCGRFVSARKRQELLEEFAIERDRVGEDRPPDYNVSPTKQIYAVLDRHERDEEKPETRELRLVRWGLVPSWAKDAAGGARLINARAETVAAKPAFRSAFRRRRCLIPADGYYEWMPGPEGSKAKKQPFYIHRTDNGILSFAGLYELWRDKTLPDDDERAWLWTATIITTDATDDLGRIHDRMPMVIARDNWADWLDPNNTDTALLQATMLPAAPSAAGGLTSYPISTAVNSVRNNGPELIEPAPAGDEAPPVPGSGGGQRPALF
jgi:putative SOS response-associated peptidase YedK